MTEDQAVEQIIAIEHCTRNRALNLTAGAVAGLRSRTPRVIVTYDRRTKLFTVDHNG